MLEFGNSRDGESDSRQGPDTPIKSTLSIALIGPDEDRRRAFMNVLSGRQSTEIREFTSYPRSLDEVPQTLGTPLDVVIIDADCDPDYVFDLVARLASASNAAVMVYSGEADVKQAVRFMRAGAREYFTLPLIPAEVAGALTRASIPQAITPVHVPKSAGQVFVFLGTKGGCGVTSIAANFAISVAMESSQSTLLIDLGQPLGDAAINLGMIANYSTANALREYARLDSSFLNTLLTKHEGSGLSVLAAPSEFPKDAPPIESFDKLLTVARQGFNYVVIDLGSRVDLMDSSLFEDSSTVFLITQVGISELRNANRFIGQYFALRGRSLQIVLNRYTANSLLFDDAQITKALTRPAYWKIPDDYSTARRTQSTATPIAMEDSSIAQTIRQMARSACGLPEEEKKRKKGFSLFGK